MRRNSECNCTGRIKTGHDFKNVDIGYIVYHEINRLIFAVGIRRYTVLIRWAC